MEKYKKLDNADITYIKEIVKDEERVLVGDFINEEYSHDELGGTSSYPDIVVRAKSPEEISAIMKYNSGNTKRCRNRTGRIFRSNRTWNYDRHHAYESYSGTGRGKSYSYSGAGSSFDGTWKLCRRT